MAFFALTSLGYQDPLRAAQIQRDLSECTGDHEKNVKLPLLVPSSSYVSYEKYHEKVRRQQDLRTPKQMQRFPLTTAQQYGWWLLQEPKVKIDNAYPWIQSLRHPIINSSMTRFVDEMAVTNKEFRLF